MRHRSRSCGLVVCATLLLALAVPSPVVAGLTGVTLRIDASSDLGSGYVEIPLSELESDGSGTYSYNYQAEDQNNPSLKIYDSQDPQIELAGISSLDITYVADPEVSLNFSAIAGTSTTTFTFTSAIVSFPALTDVIGFAQAGATTTDRSPFTDGTLMSGLFPGPKSYRSYYDSGVTPGTTFADLLDPVSSASPAGGTGNEDTGTFLPIGGTVGSIQSQFFFTLSSRDSVSGTSVFFVEGELVPEPSTVVLLGSGVAGLLLLGVRGRRSKKHA